MDVHHVATMSGPPSWPRSTVEKVSDLELAELAAVI